MEATGGLERPVRAVLEPAGLRCAVVNPRQVRDFAKAMGILAKTDSLDALVLASLERKWNRRLDLVRTQKPRNWKPS